MVFGPCTVFRLLNQEPLLKKISSEIPLDTFNIFEQYMFRSFITIQKAFVFDKRSS